ncbi:MAG: sulfotransferase family 2 domain-containing protein [Marinosulfonomonas sp.]
MIISRGRRYIFVHIPKTGGTSLSLALEDRAMKDDILIGDTPKATQRRKRLKAMTPEGRLWKHSGLRDIAGVLSDEEIADFFVVTLVRNPWDRMVSYYHWLREQNWDHAAVSLAKSTAFSDFIAHADTQSSIKGANYASYVTDRHGAEQCDLFVKLEDLANGLSAFEDHLGFSLGKVGRMNRSDRNPDYRVYYDDQTAEAVARFCAADIKRFDYSF